MKIGLFYTSDLNGKVRGCTKVVLNLLKGLEKIGHEVVRNGLGEKNGCLQGDALKTGMVPSDALIGPEIMVLPNEKKELWGKFKNWCQPSQWVIDYMQTFSETASNKFFPWPVGIDADKFNSLGRSNKFDVLIYYKNVTKQCPPEKLVEVEKLMIDRGLSYKVLTYGDYTEDEFINLCKSARCMVMLAGTESQGIAYMEALAMDLPIYVIDKIVFEYADFKFRGASSAPYFDVLCGEKHRDLRLFDIFWGNVLRGRYYPRDYILAEHTLEKGAEKYVEILEKI